MHSIVVELAHCYTPFLCGEIVCKHIRFEMLWFVTEPATCHFGISKSLRSQMPGLCDIRWSVVRRHQTSHSFQQSRTKCNSGIRRTTFDFIVHKSYSNMKQQALSARFVVGPLFHKASRPVYQCLSRPTRLLNCQLWIRCMKMLLQSSYRPLLIYSLT